MLKGAAARCPISAHLAVLVSEYARDRISASLSTDGVGRRLRDHPTAGDRVLDERMPRNLPTEIVRDRLLVGRDGEEPLPDAVERIQLQLDGFNLPGEIDPKVAGPRRVWLQQAAQQAVTQRAHVGDDKAVAE